MDDGKSKKRMITAKLDVDVHLMLKILAKQYKKQGAVEKGKVSISDAARLFVEQHDPALARMAQRQAEEQDRLADRSIDEDEE